MRQVHAVPSAPVHGPLIGIEAGGTRTTACCLAAPSAPPRLATFEAANLQLVSDEQVLSLFRRVAESFPPPAAVGIAMAGARTEADRHRIRTAAHQVWRDVPIHATHDLDAALAAADPVARGRDSLARTQRILILSGTGSCCYGTSPRFPAGVKVGGWGHLLGDQGSGYDIALGLLRALVQQWDQTGRWPPVGRRLLRQLDLPAPDALIPWITRAEKGVVAALAPLAFAAAKGDDRRCQDLVNSAAETLAHAAVACARRLGVRAPGDSCQVVLAGSVILQQPTFADRIADRFREQFPHAAVAPLRRSGAEGAARLALRLATKLPGDSALPPRPLPSTPTPASTASIQRLLPKATQPPPTESRHPASMHFDRMPVRKAVELMIHEDRRLPDALMGVAPDITRAVQLVARALKRGGRLLYVGAGTSGRLGVLDASECPPTFRTSPDLVQGILAGGETAMFRAVEGAEDDYQAGGRALSLRKVSSRDVVVGIAASGRTPFVWGALAVARHDRAATVLVTLQPHLQFPRGMRPRVVIAPEIGPELLTGSTRLKSGTVTKQILNILTTLAMVRLGKVMGNLMVDLNPSNTKLRDRAVRIVRELTGVPETEASDALQAAHWNVRQAVLALRRS